MTRRARRLLQSMIHIAVMRDLYLYQLSVVCIGLFDKHPKPLYHPFSGHAPSVPAT